MQLNHCQSYNGVQALGNTIEVITVQGFEWHSGSSCLQNGEGERLKQILLVFIIGHLIVANCKEC
jgi:hypothetical protein